MPIYKIYANNFLEKANKYYKDFLLFISLLIKASSLPV